MPHNHEAVLGNLRQITNKRNPDVHHENKNNIANGLTLTSDEQLRCKKSCNRQIVLPHTSSERQFERIKFVCVTAYVRHLIRMLLRMVKGSRAHYMYYLGFWDSHLVRLGVFSSLRSPSESSKLCLEVWSLYKRLKVLLCCVLSE